jgi:hypothetical protein
MKPLNGRRLARAEAMERARWIPNAALGAATAKMAPRQFRKLRAKQLKIKFRPIYGYLGCPAPEHKTMIGFIRAKDADIAIEYEDKVRIGKAIVAWGKELQQIDRARVANRGDGYGYGNGTVHGHARRRRS